MSDLKIFHEYTNLTYLKVTIDDFEIFSGDLMNLQVDQSFKSVGLLGKLEFKDTFDIFNNSVTTLNNTNIVKVSVKDFSQDSSIRTYRITNISHRKFNERFRIVTLSLLDEVTYKLSQTHVDKFYNGDCAFGVKSLIESVCSKELEDNKLSIKATGNLESSKSNMLCNSSQNCLEFIISKLAKYNLRFFQTRGEIYIKELKPSELTPLEFNFTDKTMNNKYIYKIFDRQQMTVSNLESPKTEIYRINGKNVNTSTKNLEDMKSEMILNQNIVDTSNLQNSSVKMNLQASLTEGQQKLKVFNDFINTNRMFIAVPGTLAGGNIDTVIKTTFNGLIGFSDLTTEGDTMNSGNYYVSGVSDLYIGEKYIQKLVLSRTENIQPRDLR